MRDVSREGPSIDSIIMVRDMQMCSLHIYLDYPKRVTLILPYIWCPIPVLFLFRLLDGSCRAREINVQLYDLLGKGFIHLSVSSWGDPILFYEKEVYDFEDVLDYRQLNKVTVKNCYAMPRIDDLFDKL